MTDLRERRRRGEEAEGTRIQRETLSLSHYLFLTHTCGGGKVNLMEDFSTSHTSKHRTEGREGKGGNDGTIGHPGDGGNEGK